MHDAYVARHFFFFVGNLIVRGCFCVMYLRDLSFKPYSTLLTRGYPPYCSMYMTSIRTYVRSN
jgi:hypothetical protein